MEFAWENNIGNFIASMVVIVLVYALLFFVISKVSKRRTSFIFLVFSFLLYVTAYLLTLETVCQLISFVSAAGLAACFFANLGDLRKFIANPFLVALQTS